MSVSANDLARISRNPDPRFYDLAGDARALAPRMERSGISTPRRKAAFLANVCQGMAVEIAPFLDGFSDPKNAEHDGSVGVVEVKSGPRAGQKPLVPAACLVPLSGGAP